MKIPDIARRIREIADLIEDDYADEAEELRELADKTRRRQAGAKAPTTSTSMSDELREAIREFKKSHPSMSQQRIAEHFNVNHGRISETLRGKRR